MFRASSAHLQEDTVVYMQHMVLSLYTKIRGGLSVHSLSENSHFGHGIVQCTTDLEHLYQIYSIPTHDKHQWLLLQFIVVLMMDTKGVRNV